jgi:hypothetical protein
MNNFFVDLWKELDPVIELFVYLGIAFAISKLTGITFIQGVLIVFGYFVLSVLRLWMTR